MPPLVETKHLSRYYNQQCAVDDVSFVLNKGEILGFLGPNGAGKTTTMQMLCGNLAPSVGEILIDGIDLMDQPTKAKRRLGYLPDTPPLYKELTVTEFLTFCARLHGIPGSKTKAAVAKAVERCDLGQVCRRLIAHLSKGFQQRVGIAQAIIHEPELIVLDEPTVGLDPIQIREIRTLIRELGQTHGVILSTHILSEVQESCTHVQIIHHGRLVLHEPVNALNQRMNNGLIKISTRLPVNPERLLNIKGVTAVEALSQNTCLIHHPADSDIIEPVAQVIMESGWGLQQITPQQQSVEDIFITLTREPSLQP